MATEITMPKLSDTMEEGTIIKWNVREGDKISRGDVIAEVETDKAAMEMEAFEDGVVSSLEVAEGETVAVGTLIAVLDGEGSGDREKKTQEKPKEKPDEEKTAEREESPEEKKPEEKDAKEKPAEGKQEEKKPREKAVGKQKEEEKEKAEEDSKGEEKEKEKEPPAESGEKEEHERQPPLGRGVTVAPAARRLAREKGVDLRRVRGTGPGGRITPGDVEKAAASEKEKRSQEPETEWDENAPDSSTQGAKSVKIRRIVARKMVESWQNAPHFFVTVAVDMTDVIRFRKDVGVSINDFILTAVARSLRDHPWVNSHWDDGQAMEQEKINICLAVATENGLYNPVIKDCGKLSLREVHRRAADLADKAHKGKLSQDDLQDGTFTVSNMGMLGVESFSAIITPPQAAVLAVGTIKGEVVVKDDAEPGVAPILRLTLSADHRMLDGADAAEFLATLKSYLEAPITLITGEAGH